MAITLMRRLTCDSGCGAIFGPLPGSVLPAARKAGWRWLTIVMPPEGGVLRPSQRRYLCPECFQKHNEGRKVREQSEKVGQQQLGI